jgi:hypothetical protein
MLTFAVISVVSNPDLDQAIAVAYPLNSQRVSPTVCLVADTAVTAREVCKKLGVKDNTTNGLDHVVVVQIASYFGHASKEIWDWLSVKTSTT